ncbi:MAG: hypothetical protein A3J55_02285 [Candidatus Ryanbacteria bacterium RIFCSPHIGHO2_02_FULL_45_17b]|uniref:Probable lipid II flippase MurJ n=1 Tax=Candidatus Ryanbacteria bacterium RIFCSPHIGHO2_01_FULL_45_22 TaxID=1802114 RepID=A0A1G2FYS3_9BACT|nr:MAG: hypothetical protein A2719_00730 [Candidatus Ryanbacteria bacterium RIFCSPHIGHO2_01_FULL_45_22]OGZ46762.1 MAG: hypothetical protein A3J55_02285 [Candidatus Ryanbacteria bacterium RIFCSPHIGHO2_02_FULL_45_17b]
MARRIFELFHREFRDVREAAFLLAIATIISNLLALLRDRLLAARFGAGIELDIYYAAFRVPDLLYAFSLFFVASTAIIPLFLERLSESEEKAREFLDTVLVVFLTSLTLLALVAYVVMPFIVPYYVPGFDMDSQQNVIHIARILLISPLFLGLSGLISSILQSFRRFFVYATTFLFYNVGIIIGILVFVPRWGLPGLAGGVVLGAFLHVLIQVPSLLHTGFFPRVHFRTFSDMVQVFRRSFPRTVGIAVTQVTFVVVTAIASTLGAGSIAIFQLSFNLQSIPLAVIGLSYSVAAFPTMAELIVKRERTIFFEHLVSASRSIIFWTLPMAILFIVLRAHIVRVVLGAGEFGWADTRLTAASLALFAIGIVAQSLTALFVRAFYAIGNVRVPIVINTFALMVTVVCAFFFVRILQEISTIHLPFFHILRVVDVPQGVVLGLPLAFALGALVNMALLGFYLRRTDGGDAFRLGVFVPFLRDMAGASALLGIVSYAILQVSAALFDINTFFGIFLHGFLAGTCGIGSAIFFLRIRGNKELEEVRRALGGKFWRKPAIGLEPEHL